MKRISFTIITTYVSENKYLYLKSSLGTKNKPNEIKIDALTWLGGTGEDYNKQKIVLRSLVEKRRFQC